MASIFSYMTGPPRCRSAVRWPRRRARARGRHRRSQSAKPRWHLALFPLAPDLWATIDVCNPADQPNTIGIRGSMPGDGQAHDTMYMRFRLQYMNATSKKWVDLAITSAPGFLAVGPAKSVRQGGRSFQLVPVKGKPAFTLRGVVSFEWRRGTTVRSRGHAGLAGSDRPPGTVEPRGRPIRRVQRPSAPLVLDCA